MNLAVFVIEKNNSVVGVVVDAQNQYDLIERLKKFCAAEVEGYEEFMSPDMEELDWGESCPLIVLRNGEEIEFTVTKTILY